MCKSIFDVRHQSSKMQDSPLLSFFKAGLSRARPTVKLRNFGVKRTDKGPIPTERRLKSSRFEGQLFA